MAGAHEIRNGMQVLGSDGGMIGTVTGTEGDRIAVKSAGEQGGDHHHVPLEWIARVDDHVHLDRTAATAWDSWRTHGQDSGRVAATEHREGGGGAHPRPSEGKKGSWIPWLVLAILVLLGIVALARGLNYASEEPNYDANPTQREG